jgi:hypothetical protein
MPKISTRANLFIMEKGFRVYNSLKNNKWLSELAEIENSS